MPVKDESLHGSAPDESRVALLLIDVINDLEFEGGEILLKHALPIAKRIRELKGRAEGAGIPAVYVNDNFGRWRSDFKALVRHCTNDEVRGRPVVRLLAPEESDYFVLKPKNSGFFSTSLELLLNYLGARTLILTGMAGNNCVLFTAGDAYLRGYKIIAPADCIASLDRQDNIQALYLMAKILGADTRKSEEIDLKALQNGEA